MRDYYATLRIQQGRLKAAMQELGIETSAELSRRSGVSPTSVCRLMNFRDSPRTKKGEWRNVTLTVCKALGSEPSEIFPDHLDHEISTNCIASFVEHAQLKGTSSLQIGPIEECENAEMEQTLDEVLETLTERERSVLKYRFWECKTLEETGKECNVNRERARQIEAKAFRKLKHPSKLRKLQEVCMWK